MTTTATKSIKAVIAACEAFEASIGHSVLNHRLERTIREDFEREARQRLGGVEVHADVDHCDTVEEMMAVITAEAGGDVQATRIRELVKAVRLDTEKLWGHFYLADLCEVLDTLGKDLGSRLDYIQAAFNRKGVCLRTTPCDYSNLGYHQKDALHALADLLALLDHPRVKTQNDSVVVVEDFEAWFPGAKVQVYKNGNIVVKGLGYGNTRLAEAFLTYLKHWEAR